MHKAYPVVDAILLQLVSLDVYTPYHIFAEEPWKNTFKLLVCSLNMCLCFLKKSINTAEAMIISFLMYNFQKEERRIKFQPGGSYENILMKTFLCGFLLYSH